MNVGAILKRVGSAVIKDVVPGGNLIIDAINSLLPEDKKLPETATGTQAVSVIKTLPPDKQLEVMLKEIDAEIAETTTWAKVQASLAQADAAGASTRPYIAKMMAWVVCFTVVVFVLAWAAIIFYNRVDMVKMLSDSWPLMLAILATPTALLRAYFGMRTKEKRSRYANAIGHPQSNVLADIIKAIKGN